MLSASFLESELGNAIVFKTPEKKFVVVDPGPARTAHALVDYLEDSGATSIVVVVTNPTLEHIGALEDVLRSVRVSRVIHGEEDSGYRTWHKTLEELKSQKIPESIFHAGDKINLSQSTRMEVLNPPAGLIEDADPQDNSLVVKVSYGRKSFLLASDAGTQAESSLIASAANVESDVLVVGRHGRSGGTSLEFLSQVRPKCCVVLCGTGANRPCRAVLNRIAPQKTGAVIYRTDENGTVDMVSDGSSITIEARE